MKFSRDGIIEKKYKRNFPATVNVEFDNKINCEFKATIRPVGDYKDHILVTKSKEIYQSVFVNLKYGNINGFTKTSTDIEFELGKLSIFLDEKNSIYMKGPVSEIKEINIKL